MNKVFKGLGAIFVLIGLYMIISTWVVYSIDTKIVNDNFKAKAIVIEKYIVATSDGDSDNMLKYFFIADNNKSFWTNRSVSEEIYNQLSENDTIEIYYAKDDPARNFPAGSGHTSTGLSIFIMILGIIFIGFGLLIIFARIGNNKKGK